MLSNNDLTSSTPPAANGTDGGEACPARSGDTAATSEARSNWYVAFTRSNAEKSVASALQAAGFDTYLAVREELHQWSDRKKKVSVRLIPRTVFVRTEAPALRSVLSVPGICGMLKAPGQSTAAVIPDTEMQRFMFMIGNSDVPVTISAPSIRKGEKVTVVRGSLRGMEGYAASDSEGMRRLTIHIDNLCCASVSLPLTDLAPV